MAEHTLNWEQKLDALNKLEACALVMISPGVWRVQQSIEIKTRALLSGVAGVGHTPEAAVEDHWTRVTSLEPHQYLIVRAYRPDRAAARWNDYMWQPVSERLEVVKS
jgi:hypothetical protein